MQLPDTTGWTTEQRIDWLRNCTPAEWDSICKRCGICCLKKVDFSDWGVRGVWYTRCACPHLNLKTRQCEIYPNRLAQGKDFCRKITLRIILRGEIIPASCGYSEFIYGPAKNPAALDWADVQNTADNILDIPRMMCNLISGSTHWNRR